MCRKRGARATAKKKQTSREMYNSSSPLLSFCHAPLECLEKSGKTHQTGKAENNVSHTPVCENLSHLLRRVVISYFSGEVAYTKEIHMSLSKRFFLFGSILLMVALLFTVGTKAPSAHAAFASPSAHSVTLTTAAVSADASSCPSATVCFYLNDDYTGDSISCATDVCRGAWDSTHVDGQGAGSVDNNSNSIFFLDDKADGLEYCELPGRYSLNHRFGYYYVEYGVSSCNGALVPPPPS
jgi:Peptidase inhibitor family I36